MNQVDKVLLKHRTIVITARNKHAAGLPLNGTERYIIKNNVGYSPLLD
jgi:hypothetical protein